MNVYVHKDLNKIIFYSILFYIEEREGGQKSATFRFTKGL